MREPAERYAEYLEWRGVETPCVKCGGSGVRVYGSTATWRGGMGGCSMTSDVCDHCWGSGDENRKGADLRAMSRQRAAWEDEQCLQYFARKTGCTLGSVRAHMNAIADILERETRRRKTPFDNERSGPFWWNQTLHMVSAALRSLGAKEGT